MLGSGHSAPIPDQGAMGLSQWEVVLAELPWHAGATGVPLTGTYNLLGLPSVYREAHLVLYDDHMQQVGCIYNTATLTAPSSQSSPAGKPQQLAAQ